MAQPAPSTTAPACAESPHRTGKRRRRPASGAVQSLTSSAPESLAQPSSASTLARRAEVQALLHGDRRLAGESRGFGARTRLSRAQYEPTAAARWHAFRLRHWYWFHGKGASVLRRRLSQACLALAVGAVCALAHGYLTPNPSQAAQRAGAVASHPQRGISGAPAPASVEASAVDSGRAQGATAEASPDPGPPATDAVLEGWLRNLSPHARVVRADAVAQGFHVRSALRARRLLESALAEGLGPADEAHAQAALTEACLQLGDMACARVAVDEAIRIRPWRAGYRSLRRQVVTAASKQVATDVPAP